MSETYNPELEKYAANPEDSEIGRSEEADRLIADRNNLFQKLESFWQRDTRDLRVLVESPAEEIDSSFNEIVNRIDTETSIIREIEDTIGKDNILHGLEKGTYPTQVQFGQTPVAREGEKTLGSYIDSSEKISITEQPPEKWQLWLQMLGNGTPEIVKTLDHEIVHHWYKKSRDQAPPTLRQITGEVKGFLEEKFYSALFFVAKKTAEHIFKLKNINPEFESMAFKLASEACDWNLRRKLKGVMKEEDVVSRRSRLMSEMVAQKAGQGLRWDKVPTSSLVKILTEGYGFTRPSDIDQIISASQMIDRMRVLGFNDKQIAEVMARTEYDAKTASFPVAESKIGEELQRRGKSWEEIDTLVDLKRIEYQRQNLKAAIIAQEELDKLRERKSR